MPSAEYILVNEGENEATATALPFVVGLYFGFRSFIIILSVHVLDTDPRTGTALNVACDFLLLLVTAFATMGEASIHPGRMRQLSCVRWAFVFISVSGLSLLWSGTISLSTSIAYWCAMASDIAIVVMLLRARPVSNVCRWLMEGYVWGACAIAMIAWIMPAQSDLRLGDEELLGANQIGYVCGFAFFFALYLIREQKRRLIAPAALLAITMLRSLSKTTIVAFVVSQGFLLASDRTISRKTKWLAVLAATGVVAALWGLLSSYFEIYTSSGSQAESLTGRIGIWAYMLAEALQSPWIGHGFDSVWKVVPPFGPDQFEAAHAHNELLQQFYAYGLVGVGMFAGVYFSLLRSIRRLAKGSLRSFLFAFLLFVVVRGFADTERFDLSLPMWALVLISVLIDSQPSRQAPLAVSPVVLEPSSGA